MMARSLHFTVPPLHMDKVARICTTAGATWYATLRNTPHLPGLASPLIFCRMVFVTPVLLVMLHRTSVNRKSTCCLVDPPSVTAALEGSGVDFLCLHRLRRIERNILIEAVPSKTGN